MHEDEYFSALKDFYKLQEVQKIPREKTIIIGSYALHLQECLRAGDKPSDIDIFVINEADSNQICKIADIFNRKYSNGLSTLHFDIFFGSMQGLLCSDYFKAKKLNINDELIYVRPKELIKKDYLRASQEDNPEKYARYRERIKHI